MSRTETLHRPDLEIQISEIPVGREAELDEIRQSIATLKQGETLRRGAIREWYGISGIGKSTLVEMIEYLAWGEKITPVWMNTTSNYKILLDDTTSSEMLFDQTPIVVLFDNMERISRESISLIEERFINPLVLNGNSLLILTGRRPSRWIKWDVRQRVITTELPPFSKGETSQQVGPIGERIYPLAKGHPAANKFLAETLREKPETDDRQLINALVEQVVETEIFRDVPAELRQAFPNLSLVRQFDISLLRMLLKDVPGFEKIKDKGSLALGLIRQLISTGLVEWDSENKGYAVDQALRHILTLHMQYNQPEKYLNIHQQALSLNQKQTEGAPEHRHLCIVEELYHRACLGFHQGQTPEQIISELQYKLEAYLERYYPPAEEILSREAMVREQLRERLARDKDLQETLGPHFRKLTAVFGEK